MSLPPVPKGVCKGYWEKRFCSWGDRCKFQHRFWFEASGCSSTPSFSSSSISEGSRRKPCYEVSSPSSSSSLLPKTREGTVPAATSSDSSSTPLFVLVKKPFRHQHDMKRLILKMLENLDDDLVLLLGERQGEAIKRLEEILCTPFTTDAGRSSNKCMPLSSLFFLLFFLSSTSPCWLFLLSL
jgi:hypothetical protein